MSKESGNEMSKELKAFKKKRRFLRNSVTDTLKSVDDVLSVEGNRATVHALKENPVSKWESLQGVEGSICTYLEHTDIT